MKREKSFLKIKKGLEQSNYQCAIHDMINGPNLTVSRNKEGRKYREGGRRRRR